MRMLNLGCGTRCHPEWVNIDFTARAEGVIAWDLRNGIPFRSGSFDVVYHSHVLEHFPKSQAPAFMAECRRVLNPGGTIRVAVPDLETIARLYLLLLDKALKGDGEARARYDWILLELFDQMVRNESGGEMIRYWRQDPMPAADFVVARLGSEVKGAIESLRREAEPAQAPDTGGPAPQSIGEFRLSGEIHQWMYDRFSLGRLLEQSDFTDIRVCRADESRIEDYGRYLLDIEPDGSVRKPDSLFMEASAPA